MPKAATPTPTPPPHELEGFAVALAAYRAAPSSKETLGALAKELKPLLGNQTCMERDYLVRCLWI